MKKQDLHRHRWKLVLLAVVAIGLVLRTSGLFRGLAADYSFHPDDPKQVAALGNFLEGRYVWYVGSLFYDGYPFGLNHVDEWILRPVLAIQHAVRNHLVPESTTPALPDKVMLYYWARSLRVFYGLLCLGLTLAITRKFLTTRGSLLSTLFLAALAPLPIVATHSATGDIGTDLFTLAALYFLCLYTARHRLPWIALAGASIGLAFSAKYQGALAVIPMACYLLLDSRPDRFFRKTLAAGMSAATGFIAGTVLGTPAFLVNNHRTWSDIRANFEFIKSYNTSAEFLSKTRLEKIAYCLMENGPMIIGSLGWVLTTLALAGLIRAGMRLPDARGRHAPGSPDRNRAMLAVALCAFPFIALLISLLGKSAVQPFHFSYLQIPLILAAVYFLQTLWLHPGFRWKGVASLLFLLAGLEFGISDERDYFFWSRADNLTWKENLPGLLLCAPPSHQEPEGVIKSIYLESGGLSIFRNRAREVTFPHADYWNRIHIAPVPDVPLSVDQNWIFPNGPVFPRNDRMMQIRRDATVSRQIVFHTVPGPLHLGVRSGSWPATLTLDLGGAKRTINLPPNRQILLPVTPQHWRKSAGTPSNPEGSYIVPFTGKTEFGSVTVSLMTEESETHLFKLFGGDLTSPSQLWPSDIPTPELVAETAFFHFLEGNDPVDLVENTTESSGHRFPKSGITLPCGPYLLQCEIRSLTPESEVTLKLDDLNRCHELTAFEESFPLRAGLNVVTSRFSKAFAPYEGQLELTCLKGRCRLISWMLIPDTARIRADLESWSHGGSIPAWLGRGAGTNSAPPEWAGPPLTFDDNIRLTRLVFPPYISQKEHVPIACAMAFNLGGLAHFLDYVVFIHMLDKEGHTVHQFHFQLWKAMALGDLNKPILCEAPASVPPGEYRLEVGLYNARTEQRVSIQGDGLSARERKKRNHVFGKTTLRP